MVYSVDLDGKCNDKLWSKYFLDLPPGSEVKNRYEEKMSLAGFSDDPCCRLEVKGKGSSAVVSVEWTNWPDISWPDISVQLSDFDARSYP